MTKTTTWIRGVVLFLAGVIVMSGQTRPDVVLDMGRATPDAPVLRCGRRWRRRDTHFTWKRTLIAAPSDCR